MVAALWIWIAALSGLCVHAQSLSELGASDFREATAKGTWYGYSTVIMPADKR